MIRINKPVVSPNVLTIRGVAATGKNCLLYDSDPAGYISGRKNFKISPSIYSHKSVKGVLRQAQRNKCCFCEKSQVDENGEVEHYRPKNGYKSNRRESLKKPGYYWLAYEWSNLFFVCRACNSITYKGNLFPLQDEQTRASDYHDDLSREAPFLINPSQVDPRQHIIFDKEFPIALSNLGKKTIEICGLDRDALIEKRRNLKNQIDLAIIILYKRGSHTQSEINQAIQFLRTAISVEGEFSSFAIDYINTFNIHGLFPQKV